MSSALAVIAPSSFKEAQEMSTILAKSALLSDALRGKPADVLLILMTGAELGFGPAQSIRAIDVIKGKPSLKAETQVALVKSRRDVCEYFTLISSTATAATYETKRVGALKPTVMSFTAAEAAEAGLSGDNWKKFKPAMLRARASAYLCRAEYPDVTLGLPSTEEVQDYPEVAGESAPFEYTPSTAPKASPPIDGAFAEVESDGLKAFKLAIGACLTVPEMEACWKAADKGDHDQQAKMTAAYKLRKAEITAPKESPTVAAEIQEAS